MKKVEGEAKVAMLCREGKCVPCFLYESVRKRGMDIRGWKRDGKETDLTQENQLINLIFFILFFLTSRLVFW